MKALVKEDIDVLGVRLAEIDPPMIGLSDVRLVVIASAICGSDLRIANNTFPWRPGVHFPLVMGHEGIGVVQETGSGVQEFTSGDRVIPMSAMACGTCPACMRGQGTACTAMLHLGVNRSGVFADQVVVPATGCIAAPGGFTDEQCALIEPLAVVAHTFERRPLDPGEDLVIVGPGPLGLLHLMAARNLGARRICVLGTGMDTSRLGMATRLGADKVVSVSDPEAVNQAMAVTDGRGFDLAIEAAGNSFAVELALTLVRSFGDVQLKGLTTDCTNGVLPIIRRGLSVRGEAGASIRHYETAIQWIRQGLDPGQIVTHRIGLSEGAQAFERMEGSQWIPMFVA